MTQAAQQGENRTGIAVAGPLAEEMVAATREFPPSSPGSAEAIGEVRIEYVENGASLGETPPPAGLLNKAKAAVTAVTGGQPTLLLDKLGERLAFEHAGARLYEALITKHRAYGSFSGGPGAGDLMHILDEEYEHATMLEQVIAQLGGDPTTVTPSANLAANISSGLPQVLTDPRTNLLQCLEAILVAELSDNECWTALAELAEQANHGELTEQCEKALEHEQEHLDNVRRWVAAGQGRSGGDGAGAEAAMAGDTSGTAGAAVEVASEEFTFTERSPVDAEGFVMSEEEAREEGSKPKPKRR